MHRSQIRSGLKYRDRRYRYALKHWSNRLPGEPAFILGCAPSAATLNTSLLKNYFTIGINRSYRLLEPTILLWQDRTVWETDGEQIMRLSSLRVAREGADPRKVCYNLHVKGGDYYFDPEKKTHILYGSGSTGAIAVEFAYALGCYPIVLLGMDGKKDQDGNMDFYGRNPFWSPRTEASFNKALRQIRDKCPVEIINCSNNNYWPQKTLEEAISMTDSEKMLDKGREYYMQTLTIS